MVGGPPRPLAELALWLGLGPAFIDTPSTRTILKNLDLDPGLAAIVGRRLRSFDQWRGLWEDLAAPHLKAAELAAAGDDPERSAREIRTALALLGLAHSGDGYYVVTLMPQRRAIRPVLLHLQERLRDIQAEAVERLSIPHRGGSASALLHLPLGRPAGSRPVPGLVCLHPLAGDKDGFDLTVAPFRAAGFATLCVDLPAHGDQFDGPRLRPDDEAVALSALDVLARRPEVDADRIGVMGGSLGAFFALRTAARAGGRLRACLAYASPFDIGGGLRDAAPGIRQNLGWAIGAQGRALDERAQPFNLRAGLEAIECPVGLIHGTLDHVCDFTATYEIARRIRAPLMVHPVIGADHEAALPAAQRFARPGIDWLREVLKLS